MRISDWSSDVCSSDLVRAFVGIGPHRNPGLLQRIHPAGRGRVYPIINPRVMEHHRRLDAGRLGRSGRRAIEDDACIQLISGGDGNAVHQATAPAKADGSDLARSEEHTSELQSLMRISYAVFCLKKKNKQ